MVRALEMGGMILSCGGLSGCFILFHDGNGAGGRGTSDVTASATQTGATTTVAENGVSVSGSVSSGVADCVAAGGQCAPAET